MSTQPPMNAVSNTLLRFYPILRLSNWASRSRFFFRLKRALRGANSKMNWVAFPRQLALSADAGEADKTWSSLLEKSEL